MNKFNKIDFNSNFFDLSDSKEENENKIDGVKKTLDRTFDICGIIDERYIEDKKYPKEKLGIPYNDVKDNFNVTTGTDYHGDGMCFQAGAVSELVTWQKNAISVMYLTDGKALEKHYLKDQWMK